MKTGKAELIEKWLKEGTDEAENIIDLPWDVEKEVNEEDGYILLLAKHLRFPIPLLFRIDDYNTTIAMQINYATDSLDTRERMEIYRNLLKINTEIPYVKVGLVGDDLYILLFGEVETKAVDHDLLNDYMEVLMNGLYKVATVLNLEEDLLNLTLENIVSFVDNKRKSGMKKNEIEEYLAKKLGMPKEQVSEIVNKIYEASDKREDLGNLYA